MPEYTFYHIPKTVPLPIGVTIEYLYHGEHITHQLYPGEILGVPKGASLLNGEYMRIREQHGVLITVSNETALQIIMQKGDDPSVYGLIAPAIPNTPLERTIKVTPSVTTDEEIGLTLTPSSRKKKGSKHAETKK